MAINKPFSKNSREELARHLEEPWMRELIENLRYAATFADRSYTDKRAISEVEHQALNGSFREGAAFQVERILLLAKDPPTPAEPKQPWGEFVDEVPNPKALSQSAKR